MSDRPTDYPLRIVWLSVVYAGHRRRPEVARQVDAFCAEHQIPTEQILMEDMMITQDASGQYWAVWKERIDRDSGRVLTEQEAPVHYRQVPGVPYNQPSVRGLPDSQVVLHRTGGLEDFWGGDDSAPTEQQERSQQ